MTHNTAEAGHDEWRSTIPPAEAVSDFVHKPDADPPTSDVRAGLFVAVAITSIWVALLWHLVTTA